MESFKLIKVSVCEEPNFHYCGGLLVYDFVVTSIASIHIVFFFINQMVVNGDVDLWNRVTHKVHKLPSPTSRRYMARILQIRRKTLQSINHLLQMMMIQKSMIKRLIFTFGVQLVGFISKLLQYTMIEFNRLSASKLLTAFSIVHGTRSVKPALFPFWTSSTLTLLVMVKVQALVHFFVVMLTFNSELTWTLAYSTF